jgi:hypothetical protein
MKVKNKIKKISYSMKDDEILSLRTSFLKVKNNKSTSKTNNNFQPNKNKYIPDLVWY